MKNYSIPRSIFALFYSVFLPALLLTIIFSDLSPTPSSRDSAAGICWINIMGWCDPDYTFITRNPDGSATYSLVKKGEETARYNLDELPAGLQGDGYIEPQSIIYYYDNTNYDDLADPDGDGQYIGRNGSVFDSRGNIIRETSPFSNSITEANGDEVFLDKDFGDQGIYSQVFNDGFTEYYNEDGEAIRLLEDDDGNTIGYECVFAEYCSQPKVIFGEDGSETKPVMCEEDDAGNCNCAEGEVKKNDNSCSCKEGEERNANGQCEEQGLSCLTPNEPFKDEADEQKELAAEGGEFCWCLRAQLYYDSTEEEAEEDENSDDAGDDEEITAEESADPDYDPFAVGEPAKQNTQAEDDGSEGGSSKYKPHLRDYDATCTGTSSEPALSGTLGGSAPGGSFPGGSFPGGGMPGGLSDLGSMLGANDMSGLMQALGPLLGMLGQALGNQGGDEGQDGETTTQQTDFPVDQSCLDELRTLQSQLESNSDARELSDACMSQLRTLLGDDEFDVVKNTLEDEDNSGKGDETDGEEGDERKDGDDANACQETKTTNPDCSPKGVVVDVDEDGNVTFGEGDDATTYQKTEDGKFVDENGQEFTWEEVAEREEVGDESQSLYEKLFGGDSGDESTLDDVIESTEYVVTHSPIDSMLDILSSIGDLLRQLLDDLMGLEDLEVQG